MNSSKTSWTLTIVFLALYVIATFFPEKLWGLHFLAFLSTPIKLLIISLSVILLLIGSNSKFRDAISKVRPFKWWSSALIAIFIGFLLHLYSFHNDFYGDAPRHKALLGEKIETLDLERTNHLYQLNVFDTKIGEKTTLNLVEKVAYYFEANPTVVFQWIGIICGSLFIFIWTLFVPYYLENKKGWFPIWILGITAPFLQIFAGHIEIYAPVILTSSVYLMTLLLFMKTREQKWIWFMFLLLFLSLKFHFASILLIPSFIVALVLNYKPVFEAKFTFKRALIFGILPVVIIGWIAYFFVFKDYNDPRFLDGIVEDAERLFLPLISPESPLDRYNLFSLNHLLDYANMLFLWSSAAILIVVFFIVHRSNTQWNKPEVILLTSTLILYMGLFFMINPLISMPMDWDLFTIPAPILLFTALILWRHKKNDSAAMTGAIFGLSIFTFAIFLTNSSAIPSSKRLISLGEHTFKTYWIRSAGNIHAGIEMGDPAETLNLLHATLESLEPYAIKNNDIEYANLLWKTGKIYRQNGQYQEALKWHLKADDYQASYPLNAMGKMESYYLLKDYVKAYDVSEYLLEQEYPSKEQALRMSIDCGLQAGKTEQVKNHCKQYMDEFPPHPMVEQALQETGTIAEDLSSISSPQLMQLLETHFVQKEFEKAYSISTQMIQANYPDQLTALSIGIHCALEANMKEEALKHTLSFLSIQEDPNIRYIKEGIEAGKKLHDLASVFSQGNSNP